MQILLDALIAWLSCVGLLTLIRLIWNWLVERSENISAQKKESHRREAKRWTQRKSIMK